MINIRTLDCGVRVITDRTDYLQSAAIGIWIKAGSVDEEDRYAGVSHFIEHMMFKGTKNRTAKQIADDMDKLGSQFNAFTSKEATCYYAKTISSNLIKSTITHFNYWQPSFFSSVTYFSSVSPSQMTRMTFRICLGKAFSRLLPIITPPISA